nr:tyrosine-protein phosphatase [Paeniglutamicibacter psychrophenolicus]
MVHCSAGRDRTGMISALLLGNAGVDPMLVAADYAASVRAMAGVANHSPTIDQQAEWTRNTVDSWLVDKLPMLREVAGGVQEIFDVLGVDTATRESLRSLLVDP